MINKTSKWQQDFFTIWTGQAILLITSAILQMTIIFYLTEKTGSAMVLSIASLVGFLPYAVFGPMIRLRYAGRWFAIGTIGWIKKANQINNGIYFYDGSQFDHCGVNSSKRICHICSLLCNYGTFSSVLQRCSNGAFFVTADVV